MAMNTHLKNVKLVAKGKPAQDLEQLSLRGNNVRCCTSFTEVEKGILSIRGLPFIHRWTGDGRQWLLTSGFSMCRERGLLCQLTF